MINEYNKKLMKRSALQPSVRYNWVHYNQVRYNRVR